MLRNFYDRHHDEFEFMPFACLVVNFVQDLAVKLLDHVIIQWALIWISVIPYSVRSKNAILLSSCVHASTFAIFRIGVSWFLVSYCVHYA